MFIDGKKSETKENKIIRKKTGEEKQFLIIKKLVVAKCNKIIKKNLLNINIKQNKTKIENQIEK